MRVIIKENYSDVADWTANYIVNAIKAKEKKTSKPFVLGLPTGSSPIPVYKKLIEMYNAGEISFKNVVTFNMDEYVGLPAEHEQSYIYFMRTNLFNHIDIPEENINIPNGNAEDLEAECARYEEKIKQYGGIDLFLGGIGVDGHIAFNEPYTPISSRTGVRTLNYDTRIVNSRFFGNDPAAVPAKALSVGVATITDAKTVMLIAGGHSKAQAIAATVEGSLSHVWTASALQLHSDAIIVCDEDACGNLKVDTYKYFLMLENKRFLI